MKVVAVIPAKGHSTRVPNKNFRDFYKGQSLLDIKIKQCLASGVFDEIFVSSDEVLAEKKPLAEGVKFLLREKKLCLDDTPWAEVLEGILSSIPVDEETLVAWTPVTSPLFNRYDETVNAFHKNKKCDSVVTVTPMKHYFLNADFIPINHQWGAWHSYSQGMKPLFQMNLACIMASKKIMIQNQYQIGNRPAFLETSFIEGVDIDTMEEFELAALIYTQQQEKANAKK